MTTDPIYLPLGYLLYAFDLLPSTMDEAHRLAREGAPEGTFVLAARQTKGRGRVGRTWVSLAGNLTYSLVLRPQCSLQEATALGFVLSVAVGHTLVSFSNPTVDISYKWPNDILINGRKVAGILLEAEPSTAEGENPLWIVGGIGVNLAQSPSGTSFPAISLAAMGMTVRSTQFLSAFCLELQELLRLWRGQGFKAIRDLWLERVWGLQREVVVLRGEEKIQGVFEDIGLDGALILRDKLGDKQKIATGEVIFSSNKA